MTPFRPKHIAVFSLWAENVSTAAHFYRDVVGLCLLPHHDRRPAFDSRLLCAPIATSTWAADRRPHRKSGRMALDPRPVDR